MSKASASIVLQVNYEVNEESFPWKTSETIFTNRTKISDKTAAIQGKYKKSIDYNWYFVPVYRTSAEYHLNMILIYIY